MFEAIFQNKKLNKGKLVDFGFVPVDENYIFSITILDNQFKLDVIVDEREKITTRLIDVDTTEEYTLYLSERVSGVFVGKVRMEIENVLQKIANKCFDMGVFTSEVSCEVIKYVNEKYGDDLEFLWEKLPKAAIWRRKDNKKWYATLLTVVRNKLGLEGAEEVETIGLRAKPEDVVKLVDNKRYFGGYHLNKKHWISICLDGTVAVAEICKRIDESYSLAKKK